MFFLLVPCASVCCAISLNCTSEGQPFADCVPLPCGLSQDSPAGFTFSKHHHSSPGRGPFRGGLERVRQGGGWGQCRAVAFILPPSLQAAENTGLCHRQQPHSSLTARTKDFACIQPRPLPLCSFTLVSYPSFSTLPPFFPTGASFLLLCSANPGPGVWAVLIAEEKQQPIHLAAQGLPIKKEGAEVLIHNNGH